MFRLLVDGILVVYSAADEDRSSFERAVFCLEQAKLHGKLQRTILIRTKSDMLTERRELTHEGEALAKSYGIPFMETSSLTHSNVIESFALSLAVCLTEKYGQHNAPCPTHSLLVIDFLFGQMEQANFNKRNLRGS
jgi:GTPase KRas protein